MSRYINHFFYLLRKIFFAPLIIGDYLKFNKKNNGRFSVKLKDFYPCIFDKTSETKFDKHYIYHTAWAARKVQQINPKFHTDISSSLYFSSIVSAFIPVKFYDYRPAKLNLSGLQSERADLLALPFDGESVDSISCMHTVEHVGLGRYGDPIDPDGDLKAIAELKRVLTPGGNLLFVVPIGRPRIQFNAHRIYSYDQIVGYFKGFRLKEFSLISQHGFGMVYNAKKEQADRENYGCGCFWFVK